MFNMKWIIPSLIALNFAVIGQPSWPGQNIAMANGQSQAVTQTLEPVAQRPAREIATYSEDVRLTNTCIDEGGTKADCICLVQVLKYELSLGEYRQASQSQTIPARFSATQSAQKIKASSRPMVRDLTQSPDFGYRCQVARRYFNNISS